MRRAISCVYWPPKSRIATRLGTGDLPRRPQLLGALEDLALGLDRGRDHEFCLVELADRLGAADTHAGADGAHQVLRTVRPRGGAEQQPVQRGVHTRLDPDAARQFGVRVAGVRPGLVPLTLGGDEGRSLRDLSGVSLDAAVSAGRVSFQENILFTHRGLSGPAILQISSYWKPGDPIVIEPRQQPRRFVQKWRELYGAKPISSWTLTPSATEGYAKAEVTVGGVDTNELSSKTMEVRRMPGLYFIGEVVDVTGHLGGFNFQWAWASGFVAGQVV